MKLISDEEKNEHWNAVLLEGLKGVAVGSVVAVGMMQWVKTRHAMRYKQLSTSVKALMYAIPTIGLGAFFADEGSVKFDREKYHSDYIQKQEAAELERWEKLSLADKCFTKVNDNKYKLIMGTWAASLYGSWKFVDRDPIMTAAQKAVQARMYAQAITVVLLLGTILMSMHEAELKKLEPPPVPEWKRYLQEQEQLKKDK